MKILTVLLLAFLIQSIENKAVAQDIGPEENLRLLGRGIQNRKTGEALALACVGTEHSCGLVRWVYSVNQQSRWASNPIQLASETELVDNRNISTEDKNRLLKKLKMIHKMVRRDTASPALMMLGAGGSVGGLVLFAAANSNPVGIAILIVGGGAAAFSYMWFGNIGKGNLVSGKEALDTNGFNWSTKAKKVPSKYFRQYQQYLHQSEDILDGNHYYNSYQVP